MTGRWAEGIEPRGFRWVITQRLGVCERPGGYGSGHRPVRRLEEIVWIQRNEIGLIVALTSIPYNLRHYDEHGLAYAHLPFSNASAGAVRLEEVFTTIRDHMFDKRVLLHHDGIGDPVTGVVAGYLLWAGLVDSGPETVTVTERLLARELGPSARETVNMADQMRRAT